MQCYTSPSATGYGAGFSGSRQYVTNHIVSVPTQNSFAPIHAWMGYPMDAHEPCSVLGQGQDPEPEHMELEWVPVQNKRRRFNTESPAAASMGQISFSSLNVDEKLSHIVDKLNSLERSNNEIMKLSQQLNSVQVKVDSEEQRTVNHELFLKVMAYKSIDIEARSRRCNLIFHGLSESTNENLSDEMRNFMWY